MNLLKRTFLDEKFILIAIVINVVIIFISGFHLDGKQEVTLEILDHFFTIIFAIEAVIKIKQWGVKNYFSGKWNVFDFTLVSIALPSLIFFFLPGEVINLKFLIAFRAFRVIKFLRFLKFIPNVEKLIRGTWRAIKTSIIIIITFVIFNLIIAVISTFIFRELSPEYFGTPIESLYSIFKVFTIEGWYEIPDAINSEVDSEILKNLIRLFFIVILFGGGIFGLSLVNSIFVDSMVSDNNDDLMIEIKKLRDDIQELRENK
jgi:voltage-gated sodium channel